MSFMYNMYSVSFDMPLKRASNSFSSDRTALVKAMYEEILQHNDEDNQEILAFYNKRMQVALDLINNDDSEGDDYIDYVGAYNEKYDTEYENTRALFKGELNIDIMSKPDDSNMTPLDDYFIEVDVLSSFEHHYYLSTKINITSGVYVQDLYEY